jgi:integrase
MARRAKGEGYKGMKTIGKYEYFYVEKTIGETKFTGYSTTSYKDATKKMNQNIANAPTGDIVYLREFFSKWLEYKKSRIKIRTWENYDMDVRNHLLDGVGNLKIHSIKTKDLNAFYDKKTKEGCSAFLVNKLHVMLYNIFEYAKRNEIISNNPASNCELPKIIKKEMNIMSQEEMNRLLECAKGTRMYLPIRLVLATGIRRNELLALQGKDIEDGVITIARAVVSVRKQGKTKGYIKFGSTKNNKTRTITLPKSITDSLKELGKSRDELLFPSRVGKIWYPESLERSFDDVRTKADLKHIRFHDLRHTHISHMIANGADIADVSRRAGHSSLTVTMNTYTHAIQSRESRNAEVVLSFLPPE